MEFLSTEQSVGFPCCVHIKTADEAEQELESHQHYSGPAGTFWEQLGLGLGLLGMPMEDLPSVSRSGANRVLTTVGQSLGF